MIGSPPSRLTNLSVEWRSCVKRVLRLSIRVCPFSFNHIDSAEVFWLLLFAVG